jgi:hypothetical protein
VFDEALKSFPATTTIIGGHVDHEWTYSLNKILSKKEKCAAAIHKMGSVCVEGDPQLVGVLHLEGLTATHQQG